MSTDTTLDKETVLKIAKLVKLDICTTNIEQYQNDLSDILALAEQMQACDTSNVQVMTHPMDAIMRLREDKITEETHREQFQKIALNTEKGLYIVPKVID